MVLIWPNNRTFFFSAREQAELRKNRQSQLVLYKHPNKFVANFPSLKLKFNNAFVQTLHAHPFHVLHFLYISYEVLFLAVFIWYFHKFTVVNFKKANRCVKLVR